MSPFQLYLYTWHNFFPLCSVECDNEVNQILCTYFDQLQPAIIRVRVSMTVTKIAQNCISAGLPYIIF